MVPSTTGICWRKTPEGVDRASFRLFYGIVGSDDEFKRQALIANDAPNCKEAP